jgi:hypothetical protein
MRSMIARRLLAALAIVSAAVPMEGRAAGTAPAVPAFVGTWVGQVTQVGRDAPFAIVLTITSASVTTTYPDQGCAGKLTRIGTSGSTVFYVEKITKGAYDPAKQSGCIDGAVTLIRLGDKMLFGWFGANNNLAYQASATLSRK